MHFSFQTGKKECRAKYLELYLKTVLCLNYFIQNGIQYLVIFRETSQTLFKINGLRKFS